MNFYMLLVLIPTLVTSRSLLHCRKSGVKCLTRQMFVYCTKHYSIYRLHDSLLVCPEGYICQENSPYPCIQDPEQLATTQNGNTLGCTEPKTTENPITRAATSDHPTTEVPTTKVATTANPTTKVAITENPITKVATTENPTTKVAASENPTTEVPTTKVATTENPTTKLPITENPTTKVATETNPSTENSKSTTVLVTQEEETEFWITEEPELTTVDESADQDSDTSVDNEAELYDAITNTPWIPSNTEVDIIIDNEDGQGGTSIQEDRLSTTTQNNKYHPKRAPADCSRNDVFPGPTCNSYFKCESYWYFWYKPALKYCPEGETFNTAMSTCVPSFDNECID